MFCFPEYQFVLIDGLSFSTGFLFQIFCIIFIFTYYFHGMNFDALHNLTILKRLHLVKNKSGNNFFQNYKLLNFRYTN